MEHDRTDRPPSLIQNMLDGEQDLWKGLSETQEVAAEQDNARAQQEREEAERKQAEEREETARRERERLEAEQQKKREEEAELKRQRDAEAERERQYIERMRAFDRQNEHQHGRGY